MANDTWTAPSGPSAGNIELAEMQAQRTDNINVLGLAVDGDTSGTTIKHRHKSGAMASLPAAGEAGRLYVSSDGLGLYWDDGAAWHRVPQTLDTDQTVVDWSSTTSLEVLYTFSIPAGNLVVGSGLRFSAAGGVLNNTGGNEDIRWKAQLGSAGQLSNYIGLEPGAVGREWWFELIMMVKTTTVIEYAGRFTVGSLIGGNFMFSDVSGADNEHSAPLSAAIDVTDITSGAQTFTFSSQMGLSSANFVSTIRNAVLEFIPAPTG